MALGTDYIIKYLSDISGAVKGAKDLEAINTTTAQNIQKQYGQVTRVIGQLPTKLQEIPVKINGKDAIKTVQTLGEVVQTSSGKFLELGKVQTFINGKLITTAATVKDTTTQYKLGNIEALKGEKVFSNFANSVKQLAGRALLTIPIWIALRSALTGVFQGISDGIKNLIEFDLALQKIRNNLQGTPEEVSSAFKKIRSTITEASKATGVSTEEIAGAVKQFATLGFSANESIQGGLGATKLSIALFGDASDTAEAFAKALNILIDRSAGAKTAADQMNEAFALTSQLEETNNFEIKAVTEALNKFAGTAAGVGLTMNQTLQILAAVGTAGRTGSEGATLLSTSFNTLLKNLPNLSQKLGIVTSESESTFEIFNKILNKVVELNNTPGGRNAAITAISDIFGGARGIKIVQSLVAVKNILDANAAILPSFDALSQKVGRTLESESGQAKLLSNNLKETGKAFVTAVIGAEDFTSSLIKLNKVVTQIGEGLKPLGSTIHAIFSNLGFIAGTVFLLNWRKVVAIKSIASHLLASQAAIEAASSFLAFTFSRGFLTGFKFLGKYALASLAEGFAGASVLSVLSAVLRAVFSPVTLIAGITGKIAADALTENFIKGIEASNTKAQDAFNKVIDGLKGNLAIPDLSNVIEKLTLEQKPGDQAMIQQIGALRRQLQKQMESTKVQAKVPVDIIPVISFTDQQAVAKQVIDFKLGELKLQGATNSELLLAKKYYTEQLGVVETLVDISQNRLNLESAIQEETKHLSDIQKEGVINNQIEFLKLLGESNVGVIEQRIEYEKALNIHQTTEDLLNNKLELSKAITEEEIKLDNVQRTQLIENQLEILRIQGATSVQLVQQRIELERMYGINQTKEDKLRNELALNQEITKEKINQNRITSDSLKIFQIAQKFGIQKAEQAAQFLKGNVSLNELQPYGRSSDLMPIIKEFFASQLEQMQAAEFFYKGEGRNINIPERKAVEEFKPIKLENFKLPDITTQIGQINVEIKKVFKEQDGVTALYASMLDAIRNNQALRNAIHEVVDEH